MKNKHLLALLLICFVYANIAAQNAAQEIETLLGTNAVTYAQAARFILDASNSLTVSNHNEAFQYAKEQGWLPKNVSSDDTARLNGISQLLVKSFGLKGGIMYSITNAPHYAYRELIYRGIIQGRVTGAQTVSGEHLIFITGRLLGLMERAEEMRIADEEKAARRRREAMAAEISAMLVEQEVSDTTVQATETGITITLSNIQFLADSAVLHGSEMAKLQEIASILQNIPGIKIHVSGHTALAGTVESRLNISRERARVVANYLVSLGACPQANITYAGYGSDRPIADNTTEAGMALNRRVEITILEN
jgi:outer membrane protein OmpA-like peptidoglycan-associated protein